jgi:hypothetical protein
MDSASFAKSLQNGLDFGGRIPFAVGAPQDLTLLGMVRRRFRFVPSLARRELRVKALAVI